MPEANKGGRSAALVFWRVRATKGNANGTRRIAPRCPATKAQPAGQLGLNEAVDLLEETLEEEKNTDKLLTELAQSTVNEEAERHAA